MKDNKFEKALQLVCNYLAEKPISPIYKDKCPLTIFNECVIPWKDHFDENGISCIVCDNIRSKCWFKYWVGKVG